MIKTVTLDDYAILSSTLTDEELASTLFVMLVRDPRAIILSGTQEPCARQYIQALSAKEFLQKTGLGTDNFMTIFFEHWAADVEGLVEHLHGLLGWTESAEIRAKAVSDHQSAITAWTHQEGGQSMGQYCEELMSFYGYPSDSKSPDYSKLSDAKIHDPLSDVERADLAKMRASGVGHRSEWNDDHAHHQELGILVALPGDAEIAVADGASFDD